MKVIEIIYDNKLTDQDKIEHLKKLYLQTTMDKVISLLRENNIKYKLSSRGIEEQGRFFTLEFKEE